MSSYKVTDRRPIADGFRRLARIPVRWCVRLRIHANTVSYASVVASTLAALCFMVSQNHPATLFAAIGFCFLRLYFNMLDGMVAIASGTTSSTGEIANEVPDRISDVLIFVGVAHSGLCYPLIGYWAAIGSLLVAYIGTLGKAVGAHRDFSGPMSKPWRMVALAIGTVLTPWKDLILPEFFGAFQPLDVAGVVIVVGCLFTVGRRLCRIVQALQASEEAQLMESLAIESLAYRQFLTIVAVLLGIGGTLLLTVKAVFRIDVRTVARTYRSWLVMAPIPFVSLLFGREVTILLILLLSVVVFWEYAKATGLSVDRVMTRLVLASICVQTLVILATDPRLATPGWYGLFMALPAFIIAALATVPIIRNRSRGQLKATSLALFGYLYFGWMLGHLAFLANAEKAIEYLLYLLFAVSVTDVGAFTFGKLLGEAKLRDRISPNKTIGGSLGALAIAMALPWLLAFALPEFTTVQKLLTGLIIGIGGQLGDLTISYIKRDLEIKDMGQLIPGHGGLLDRVDSLIFTAPLFFHMVRWYGGIQ